MGSEEKHTDVAKSSLYMDVSQKKDWNKVIKEEISLITESNMG